MGRTLYQNIDNIKKINILSISINIASKKCLIARMYTCPFYISFNVVAHSEHASWSSKYSHPRIPAILSSMYVCVYTHVVPQPPPAPTSPAFPNNTALTVDEHKNQSKFMRCSVPPPPPYFNVEGARHKPAQESLDTTTPPATTVTVNKQPHQH